MRAFGVGGPSVDTVLDGSEVRPGGTVAGRVEIEGGDHDVAVQEVALGLVARVEIEGGDIERDGSVEFARLAVSGPFALAAGERRTFPFEFAVPYESPLTHVEGRHLRGMALGVRTELAIAKAVDKGDLDAVAVLPLPSQERVLAAFAGLGFAFARADLEHGRLYGVHQELPFYQEIEFRPPAEVAGRIGEVELTFVADPHHLAVVLEADRRGGAFVGGGGDEFGRWIFPHEVALRTDWEGEIRGWLAAVAERSGHHRGGHGAAGAMVGGVAGGLVAGMVAGEVLDEVGDFFEGED